VQSESHDKKKAKNKFSVSETTTIDIRNADNLALVNRRSVFFPTLASLQKTDFDFADDFSTGIFVAQREPRRVSLWS